MYLKKSVWNSEDIADMVRIWIETSSNTRMKIRLQIRALRCSVEAQISLWDKKQGVSNALAQKHQLKHLPRKKIENYYKKD